MKKFKDFLYNNNDIFLAIIILIVAGLLIAWRINTIMAYPETIDTGSMREISQNEQSKSNIKDSEKDKTNAKLWTSDGKLKKSISVTIAGDSPKEAVSYLVEVGLFDSYDQFEKTCEKANVSPSSIKYTTFTFSEGATKEDIVKIVTN